MGATRAWWGAIPLIVTAAVVVAAAQGPQPVPVRRPQPPPAGVAPAPPPAPTDAPTEATLGVALYPNAVFLRAYDAGRNQRYYVFGATTPFADLVVYYRNLLKERGNTVFEVPPTHVFETGRFREETMAFPPSVTIKDYTFNGSAGYPNPTPGGRPERFPTVIQIVPAPPATAPKD
jgi:hypothetical protein